MITSKLTSQAPKSNNQAKRYFGTNSDLSVEITDAERHVIPLSELRLTLLEMLHPMPINHWFEKVELREILVIVFHNQTFENEQQLTVHIIAKD